MAARQTSSNSPAANKASESLPPHPSPQSEHPASGRLPLETPARPTPKAPSAADRLAAAVMEGAPESHWTFLMERRSSENAAGIRRSKVVDEMLQPMRPTLSCPGTQPSHIPEVTSSIQNSDLPQSLIDQTRRPTHPSCRSPPPPPAEPIIGRSRLTRSAGSSPPNLIQPTPQRPPLSTTAVGPDCPSSATEQVEVLDARVNQLLSHIRSDQLEKANLVSALTEARGEVAALREEVRLLRIGVQKLGEDRPHQSADARLERCHPTSAFVEFDQKPDPLPATRPQHSSSGRQRRISLEALLNEMTLPNTDVDKPQQLDASPHQQRFGSCSRANVKSKRPEISQKIDQRPSVNLPSNQEALFQHPNGTKAPGKMTNDGKSVESSSIKDLAQHFLGDLALGLTFTRCVDQLLMGPTAAPSSTTPNNEPEHTSRSKFRPDADIFCPDNLDRLFSRLKVWKLLVLANSKISPDLPLPTLNTIPS